MVGIWKQTKEKTDYKSEKPRKLQYPLLKSQWMMIINGGKAKKKLFSMQYNYYKQYFFFQQLLSNFKEEMDNMAEMADGKGMMNAPLKKTEDWT